MDIVTRKTKQTLELCNALLSSYLQYLNSEEIIIINNSLKQLNYNDQLETVQRALLPIVEKIWNIELASGNYTVISWNKHPGIKPKGPLVYATLSKDDDIINFCDMTSGIKYEINFNSIIGAFYKDGATIREDISKKNEYTIGFIDGKVVNSYNGSTKFITPIQLINNREINYRSKHNEIVLDARLIKEIGPYEISSTERKK